MTTPPLPRSLRFDAAEDAGRSPVTGPTFGEVLAQRLSRRGVLSGALSATVLAAVRWPAAAGAEDAASAARRFNFAEVAAGVDETHHVAAGHEAQILIRWGDPLLPDAPAFDPLAQTPEGQARQLGYNNDFLGFVPIDGRSDHGLLVVNHEYTNEELMFPGIGLQRAGAAAFERLSARQVAIEMMAHGGSVIEIVRRDGRWQVVANSRHARRITAETPMRIAGPAAGHAAMRTSGDPTGTRVLGMINNCSGAVTPWGTWLSCEENINGYFWNRAAQKHHPEAAALKRYGIPGEWYGWGKFHARFDIAREPNEAHRFGWVVEIDPFDPTSTPVKRTALGRFKHEGAGNVVNSDGRFVVYQGDDERFEHIYRFVTARAVDLTNREANRDILDTGTLSVARFDADGRGEWLALVHGTGGLTPDNGFADQGEVVVKARLAASKLGATRMDRPEDIEVSPVTGKVYAMLTGNDRRTVDEVDGANPRAANSFGHIIEITPDGGDHTAATFRWEILVRCGDPAIAEVGALFNPATSASGWFASPDNCAIDALGRLWVATDGNSASTTGRADGIWGVETEGAARGTSRLFFRCPVGAEMCGPVLTPDAETFFVAVQHPGETEPGDATPSTFESPSTRWPDFDPAMPPRPAIVAITRRGGGKVGT